MTTQTLYSDKKSFGMSSKYFLGELRRSWPKMVLYFIIFCLTMIIPLLMQDMGVMSRYDETWEEYLLKCSNRLLNLITESVSIWTAVSMIAAVFSGCYVTKILNNKVSADFYHSIPMRRESIFLTRFFAGFITYFATFLVNVLIILVLCETQELAEGYGLLLFKQIMLNFAFSLLAFFMLYSTTIFAGMLCGTTVMQLLMTLYLNLAVFVYYSSLFITLEKFFDVFDASYYLEDVAIAKLLPFVRLLALDLISELSVLDICFYAIGSLLLIMGSVALYRFRKIEKAGSPIVFDGFASFFRYSVIIPVTLLGGIFFDLLVGSFVWYVIGLAISAFLCFLLINTILQKNARKMFTGIKGFGIYVAAMLVFFLVLGFDIFGIDDYVPSAKDVKRVEIKLANQVSDIGFEDEDVIRAAIELDEARKELTSYSDVIEDLVLTSFPEASSSVTYAVEEPYDEYYPPTVEEKVFHSNDYDQILYYVVYKLKTGIPIARRVTVMLESEQMTALAKAIANSEDYEQNWREHLSYLNARDYYATYDQITEYNMKDESLVEKYITDEMITNVKNSFAGIDYEYFRRPQIGRIHFYGSYLNDYNTFQMPVYLGDELSQVYMGFKTVDEYYEHLAGKIFSIVIYKGEKQDFSSDDGTVLPKDTELYKEVLKNLANTTDARNIFTESEPGYHVGISFVGSDGKYAETVRYMCAEFIKGSVPASVAALVP